MLNAMFLSVKALVPQDDWMSCMVEAPDKAKIKAIMDNEQTFKIGRVTKNAAFTTSLIKNLIRQRPATQLQGWLEKRMEDEAIIEDITASVASARMLLSIPNAWCCIMVKAQSKQVLLGEISKKEIIDDVKKRIKKIDSWKDCLSWFACYLRERDVWIDVWREMFGDMFAELPCADHDAPEQHLQDGRHAPMMCGLAQFDRLPSANRTNANHWADMSVCQESACHRLPTRRGAARADAARPRAARAAGWRR